MKVLLGKQVAEAICRSRTSAVNEVGGYLVVEQYHGSGDDVSRL